MKTATTANSAVEGWRRTIDSLDTQLVRLLNRRAQCAARIGALKWREKAPIRDPAREQAILVRVAGRSRGPLTEKGLRAIYRQIIEACCEVQGIVMKRRGV